MNTIIFSILSLAAGFILGVKCTDRKNRIDSEKSNIKRVIEANIFEKAESSNLN